MSDPETLAWYQANAPRYAHADNLREHRLLAAFLARLAPGARILELGCGAGQDTAQMIRQGFDVDATDATPAMIEGVRARLGIAARQMRFDQLSADQEYDAVWAHACLIHVARAHFPAVLSRVHRALRTGGWHFANFKLGDGEGRDMLGRLHNFPDENWLEAAYRSAGFKIIERERYAGEGADGVKRDWYALTVMANSE